MVYKPYKPKSFSQSKNCFLFILWEKTGYRKVSTCLKSLRKPLVLQVIKVMILYYC